MSTRSKQLVVSIARRNFSSSIKDRVGTFQRRPKVQSTSSSSPSSIQRPTPPPPPSSSPTSPSSSLPDELVVEDAITLVSNETKMRNAGLAAFLFTFCFGVAVYSMNAVGQAGTDPNDPLSTLRMEAAEAQQRHDRENRSAQEASDMLQQFRAGAYDPDKIEQEDELEAPAAAAKKKRPWYKFW